jgi:hypothetical protein
MGPFWNVSVQGELRVGRIEGAYRRGLRRRAGLRGSGIYAGYSERAEGPAASMAPGSERGVCASSAVGFPEGPIITAWKGLLLHYSAGAFTRRRRLPRKGG